MQGRKKIMQKIQQTTCAKYTRWPNSSVEIQKDQNLSGIRSKNSKLFMEDGGMAKYFEEVSIVPTEAQKIVQGNTKTWTDTLPIKEEEV